MKKLLVASLIVTSAIQLSAQSFVKMALPRTINSALDNEMAPTISGDGQHMVFMRENKRKKIWEMQYSRKAGSSWTRIEEIDILNKNPKLLYYGGYSFDLEGDRLYYTSTKYGGIGNYDIWYMDRTKDGWDAPRNLGKPVNSTGFDIHPSISPDGTNLYFSRHTSIKNGKPTCGKILVASRKGGSWEEPVELPATINSGCVLNPTILSDGVTLIFASNKAGGKGGFDLYMSRKEDGTWSTPRNMEFINTKDDDLYASVPAKGDVIYFGRQEEGKETSDLYKGRLPADFRPLHVLYMKGIVKEKGTNNPLSGFVQANNTSNNQNEYYARTDKNGRYTMVLREGIIYDFSIQAYGQKHSFYSEIIDISDLHKLKKKGVNAELVPLTTHATFNCATISYKPSSHILSSTSDFDINRIVKMMKFNPDLSIEISVSADAVYEDTIKSSSDLTEMRIDTVQTLISPKEIIIGADTTTVNDTVYVTKTFYHNDRTGKQAKRLAKILRQKGVPERRFKCVGEGARRKLTGTKEEDSDEQVITVKIKLN